MYNYIPNFNNYIVYFSFSVQILDFVCIFDDGHGISGVDYTAIFFRNLHNYMVLIHVKVWCHALYLSHK